MPSRLIREGILTSERVDQLDAAAEVFYRRLMSKVDDHGLFDARPSILRASLYPLRVDRVREADITRWIAACEKAGVIALYQHHGKPYLQMLDTRWTARSEPKYPLPTTENSCKQSKTPVPVFGDGVVDVVDTPKPPAGADRRFDEFWNSYPKKVGKDAARKAFDKRKPDDALTAQMLRAIEGQKRSDAWLKESGQFIPNPATWLNQGRWQDGIEGDGGASTAWDETRGGVEKRAYELGMPRWDECIPWHHYREQVRTAVRKREEVHA